MLKTFRDATREVSPRWLQSGTAEKILYAIALHFDLLAESAVLAVRRRFTDLDDTDALALLGRERRIRQGLTEPDSVYASRLRRWLDDHKTRGGPYAMLRQLQAYYAAAPFEIQLIYAMGRRFTMTTDGTITIDAVAADGQTWPHWRLEYAWPDALSDDGYWGDPGVWGDGGVWGSDLDPDTVETIVQIPSEWNAAHARGKIYLHNGGNTVELVVP